MAMNFLLHKTNKCFVYVQYADRNLIFLSYFYFLLISMGKKVISKYYALINSFFSFSY